jgi:hypothetical protein
MGIEMVDYAMEAGVGKLSLTGASAVLRLKTGFAFSHLQIATQEYQAAYFLLLSLGFACVEPVLDRIFIPARRTRSR